MKVSQPDTCFHVLLCFRPQAPVVAPLPPVPSRPTCRQLSHTQEDQRRLKAPLPGTSHDRCGAPLSLLLDPKHITHTDTHTATRSGPASARSVETLRGDCGGKWSRSGSVLAPPLLTCLTRINAADI